MKKVLVVALVLTMSMMLGIQSVFASEVIVEETNTFDEWVEIIGGFASFKNFIVSTSGLAALIAMAKLRGVYKFFKTPAGLAKIETIGFDILSKVTDSPELVMKIMAIVIEMPVIKTIIDNGVRKASMYEVEILDKIINIEAKIEAEIFLDNPTANQQAILLLEKLRDEYANIQLDK